MRRRDIFWYTTGVAIGRMLVAGRALAGQVRQSGAPGTVSRRTGTGS
jgi:hypothetical protein